jgi:hypothetical protein
MVIMLLPPPLARIQPSCCHHSCKLVGQHARVLPMTLICTCTSAVRMSSSVTLPDRASMGPLPLQLKKAQHMPPLRPRL